MTEDTVLDKTIQAEGALPRDLIRKSDLWTPEIDRLTAAVTMQMRLDSPGMLVSGAQRMGKTRACRYVAATLPYVMDYPVSVELWRIPQESTRSSRTFIQERMLQSGCNATNHRDVALLRGRLVNQIAGNATERNAKRVAIIVDEAQNLTYEDLGMLVFIFNELDERTFLPFVMLVGQPELHQQVDSWIRSEQQQYLGRFANYCHDYRGIRLDDLELVLEGFDDEAAGVENSAAYRAVPRHFALGWRVAKLAPVLRDAVKLIVEQHNIQEEVRLPMQYLRSSVLAMLYRIIKTGGNPDSFTLVEAIECVKASNLAGVLSFYVRKESIRRSRAKKGPGIAE